MGTSNRNAQRWLPVPIQQLLARAMSHDVPRWRSHVALPPCGKHVRRRVAVEFWAKICLFTHTYSYRIPYNVHIPKKTKKPDIATILLQVTHAHLYCANHTICISHQKTQGVEVHVCTLSRGVRARQTLTDQFNAKSNLSFRQTCHTAMISETVQQYQARMNMKVVETHLVEYESNTQRDLTYCIIVPISSTIR